MPKIPSNIKPCIFCGKKPEYYDFFLRKFVCENDAQKNEKGKILATPLDPLKRKRRKKKR